MAAVEKLNAADFDAASRLEPVRRRLCRAAAEQIEVPADTPDEAVSVGDIVGAHPSRHEAANREREGERRRREQEARQRERNALDLRSRQGCTRRGGAVQYEAVEAVAANAMEQAGARDR